MRKRTVATLLALLAGGALEARPPDQFEPRRKGPFTEHEKEILKHVRGKVCERQLPNDILISKPDFVVFVPEQSIFRDKIDLSKPSDTFNDHFHVFYDERRKLMYAFWTQSCTEAGPDQHVSFAKSADRGRTWTKPVILVGGEYKARPHLQASWQQPMLSKSGRLYCLWNQQVTSYGGGLGDMFGMYSDDAGETWQNIRKVPFPHRSDMDPKDPSEPPVWFNWQRPLRLGENGKYFVGCSRDGRAPYDPHRCTRVEFWQFENIDEDPEADKIRITCLNPNRAALGTEDVDEPDLRLYGVGDKTRWQTVAEAAPVKLPDGRLFTLCRSSTGYPLWSVSADGGRTWSRLRALRDRRGKPFLHPVSPCPLFDWKGCEAGSGYYIAFVHNTFDFNAKKAYQPRGPLYLLAGRYVPGAAQPIQFDDPQLFTPREEANSFYASYTYVDGEGILWYNDQKYYLLGRKIGPEWFRRTDAWKIADAGSATEKAGKGYRANLIRCGTHEKDNYEASFSRSGNPRLIRAILVAGCLEMTGQGVYGTKDAVLMKHQSREAPVGMGLFYETAYRVYALSEGATLVCRMETEKAKPSHALEFRLRKSGESLAGTVLDDGAERGRFSVPAGSLPFDLSFAASPEGRFRVKTVSLADSTVRGVAGETAFFARSPGRFACDWTLRAGGGGSASVTVDEYFSGTAKEEGAEAVPYSIERLPEFDPVKAGWKKVFEDEFDGDSVDWTKWFMPYYQVLPKELASTDGKGHLRIRVQLKPGTTNQLESTSFYTSQGFGYGYYEARVRFSEKPGWWAAFWGYGDVNTNPFLDGFEPDGFEDFYTRRKVWREKGDALLAHNLHVRSGLGRSKSFSYLSRLPRGVKDWYDFGMRWTPFEISFYLDGKLIRSYLQEVSHSPYDTVTFDAFNCSACTSPLHAALSGCIMEPGWGGDLSDMRGVAFPDFFEVDRVRIYEWPDPPETRLDVAWRAGTSPVETVCTGGVIRLAADVASRAKGRRIKAAYLFDNGYFLACRTNAPYAFEVPLTEEALGKTSYMRAGYTGQKPPFNGLPHVFHVFAQDESGRVGRTAEPVIRLPRFGGSTPYGGQPRKIPGRVSPAHFDEGGVPYGYYKHVQTIENFRGDLNPRPSRAFRPSDHASCSADGQAIDFVATGEWMNYTVDVAAAGAYDVTFAYGTPGHGINRLDFLVDGHCAAHVNLERHEEPAFARDRQASLRLNLPAGRHVLTVLPIGPLSIGTFEFTKADNN